MPNAIIDATGHGPGLPPDRVVAGLTLVERALRLAAVTGCDRAVVVASEGIRDRIAGLVESTEAELDARVVGADTAGHPAALSRGLAALADDASTLFVASSTVYRRQLVGACLEAVEDTSGPTVARAVADERPAPLLAMDADTAGSPAATDERTDADSLQAWTNALETRVEGLERITVTEPRGWFVDISEAASQARAEDALWNDCRKPVDGIVSRNFNRHVSLAVSRRIAPSELSPNQLSLITFVFGIAAAVCAGVGGFWAFLAAGLLYQLNAIADGIDGEIARVKYEFSVVGEWMDTITDDLKDVLLYGGLGWGAWQTGVAGVWGMGPDIWLGLGCIALGGKLLSMVGYYSFLISEGRGDMYAFEWSFEEEDGPDSAVGSLLSKLKYLTKDDFAVFSAMCLAFAGVFPWFLIVAAAGQTVVAVSVFIQRLKGFQ